MGAFYQYSFTMTFLKILIFFISTNFLSVLSSNSCFNEGKTWITDGQLDFIPGVTSAQDCVKMCFENNDCNGYTWFGDINVRFKNVCTLFKTLEQEYECSDCISGIKPDLETCTCEQKNGQCSISDNFIAASHSESEFDCFLKCSAIKECKYYTWFSLQNEEVRQECLLFSSCDSVDSCSIGCYIGGVDCGDEPPVTTTPAPVTTTPAPTTTKPVPTTTKPVPTTPSPTTTSTTTPRTWNVCDDIIDMGVNILHEADRSVENDRGPQYCDKTNIRESNSRNILKSSPDWKGPGWDQIKNPAGIQLSEEVVEPYHCSTSGTGWLNGPHPEILGQTVEMQVCFNSGGEDCKWLTTVQVRNCGHFFLYYLEDVPYCPLRYCAK